MIRPTDGRLLAVRVLYYLAILFAILVVASRTMSRHPSFVYQGF